MTKTRDTIETCLIASVAAVLSSGFVLFLNRARATPKYQQPHLVSARPSDVMGMQADNAASPSKPYTLVEYMDYQCPPCKRMEPQLQAFAASHKANLRLITRNFPLPMHPDAQPAAIMAEAAREQGQFPSVHAALLKSDRLDITALSDIAVQQRLDISKLNHAMRTTAKQVIIADLAQAENIPVNATPSLFLCCPDNKVVQIYDLKQAANYLR